MCNMEESRYVPGYELCKVSTEINLLKMSSGTPVFAGTTFPRHPFKIPTNKGNLFPTGTLIEVVRIPPETRTHSLVLHLQQHVLPNCSTPILSQVITHKILHQVH